MHEDPNEHVSIVERCVQEEGRMYVVNENVGMHAMDVYVGQHKAGGTDVV